MITIVKTIEEVRAQGMARRGTDRRSGSDHGLPA